VTASLDEPTDVCFCWKKKK